MPAVYVKKATNRGSGVNSFDLIFGSDVTAGNFLVACYSPWLSGGTSNVTPTGGGTWNTTTAPSSNDWNAYICYAMNVTGGPTTVTVDYGTAFYIAGSVAEFSGVETSGALDQQQVNSHSAGSDTTPDVGPTGTLAQADELVVACLAVAGSDTSAGIDACTINGSGTGVTNIHVEQDAMNYTGHSSDYFITSGTGAITAAWGTVDASDAFWAAKVATFRASSGSTPSPKLFLSLGVGK